MSDIDICIQQLDKRYSRRVSAVQAFCKKIIRSAWFSHTPAEVSLVLADDEFVHKLNFEYRGKDSATNVLSFETGNIPPKGFLWLAGDIIIAYETVLKEAKDQNKTFEAHLAHLLIHGALHLQGYDHLSEKEAFKMESLEKKIMKSLGYENPYKDVE
ncbi:MAG: rRNA maturation RNase YbeY [Alphaproteobacteria bacterium]|nr:rRNA maturation RNase YbeY [Alphaproteobacteria bacterium]